MLKPLVCLALGAALVPCFAADPVFMTGQAARAVLGQETFNTQVSGSSAPGTTQPGLPTLIGGAGGLGYAANTLFVTDANRLGLVPNNFRVMLYGNITQQLPGPTAVIPEANGRCPLCGGQITLELGDRDSSGVLVTATTRTGMRLPTAVASDGTTLAVVDTSNNRVLIWKSIPTVNSQPADLVLGQADFTTATAQPLSAHSLRGPQGVWIQNGKLFVADTGNSRVLIWNSIPTQNNQDANVVLGQSNFTSVSTPNIIDINPTTSANALWDPTSVTSDGTRLVVSDLGFNRVLIWNSIPTSNQQPADVEVGQLDMTKGLANDVAALCASTGVDSGGNLAYPARCGKTLNFPRFALSDGKRLYIADTGNNRVLVYNQVPVQNAAAPDAILGQPDENSDVVTNPQGFFFSADPSNLSATNVTPIPTSLAWDGQSLYVADPTNFRILLFSPGEPIVPLNGAVNFASREIRALGTVTISGDVVAGNAVTVTITSGAGAVTITRSGANLTGGSASNRATGTFTISSDTILSGNLAAILINGINYQYTAGSGDTPTSVASALANAINASNAGAGDPDVTASASGTTITVTARNLGEAGNSITLVGTGGYTYIVQSGDTINTIAQNLANLINSSNGGAGDPNVTAVYQLNQNYLILVARVGGSAGNNITLAASSSAGAVTLSVSASGSALAGGGSGPATGTLTINGTTITAGNIVTVSVNSANYTYAVRAADTLSIVASSMTSTINASNAGAGDPNVTASVSGSTITLTARASGTAGNSITFSGSAATTGTAATASASTLTGGANSGNLSPGAFVTIRANPGTTLSDFSASADQNQIQLPWELANTQVYMDGDRMPLFYVSPTMINAVIPWEVVNSTSISLTVRTQRNDGSITVSNAIGVPINPGVPGVFAFDGDEPRRAMAYHASSFASGVITVTGTIQAGDVATINVDNRAYSYTVKTDDTIEIVRDSLIATINANPEELVTASKLGIGTGIVLQAKIPGPEGDGIPLSVSQSTATTNTSGALLVVSLVNPITCCANVANSPVTPENPAVAGETIFVYATGLGLVGPDDAKNALGPGYQYKGPVDNQPVNNVSANVDGGTAVTLSASIVQNSFGVYQVVIQLPSVLTENTFTRLYLQQSFSTSNIVTIPVGPPSVLTQ